MQRSTLAVEAEASVSANLVSLSLSLSRARPCGWGDPLNRTILCWQIESTQRLPRRRRLLRPLRRVCLVNRRRHRPLPQRRRADSLAEEEEEERRRAAHRRSRLVLPSLRRLRQRGRLRPSLEVQHPLREEEVGCSRLQRNPQAVSLARPPPPPPPLDRRRRRERLVPPLRCLEERHQLPLLHPEEGFLVLWHPTASERTTREETRRRKSPRSVDFRSVNLPRQRPRRRRPRPLQHLRRRRRQVSLARQLLPPRRNLPRRRNPCSARRPHRPRPRLRSGDSLVRNLLLQRVRSLLSLLDIKRGGS